jgi:serine/threonine-protein phosphatase PGAM5
MIEEGHSRIEAAFENYFHRADEPVEVVSDSTSSGGNGEEEDDTMAMHPQHEFEIIVCHGNVIRYFFCRALQLPPEAWLRFSPFNCSLTYLTIQPTGTVR